ncbi:hypothetical protein NMG60_11035478 [Bertholletia excelsa]
MGLLRPFSLKTQNSSSRLACLVAISSSLCLIYLFASVALVHTPKFVKFSSTQAVSAPTNIEHIVFGIATSQGSWERSKEYVKLWWRPQMRGCVFTESPPPKNTASLNDTSANSLPPVCISEDTARFPYTYRNGPRSAIRVARVVLETVALNHSNVRWFVFGDDDTVFFPDNLAKTLSKYDHELWHYIGANSESLMQMKLFSHDMAFGGGGFAISYPLAKVLAKVFDSCLERYPHIYGRDGRVQACIAELGIELTREPGFHQVDLRGDIFGLLAAHPNSLLLSLHHLDRTHPIFPNMTSTKAAAHLFDAAKLDPHRLLQRTICYDRWYSWTISVSWGYAIQVFPRHVFLPDVLRAQRTFDSWKKGHALGESFAFDTVEPHPNPCARPTVFFFDKAVSGRDGIRSSYRRMTPDNCTVDIGSPRKLEEIRVSSHKLDLGMKQLQAPRRHCCNVLPPSSGKLMEIAIRECGEEETIRMAR